MSDFGVVLFYTQSAAIRAEKELKGARLDVKLVPTPRELSTDCGIALRFPWADRERVEVLLAKAHLELAGIHQIEPKKSSRRN